MSKKVYGKAIRTGWVLTLAGIIIAIAGVKLSDSTNETGFFALLMLGILLAIAGLVTAVVYGGMERRIRRTFENNAPLLRYTIAAEDYAPFAAAEAVEMKSTNKMSLIIALVFCGIVAFGGPFVVPDNKEIIFFIGIGLAVFLTLCGWLITKYRANKLKTADREVILTQGDAYVGGEFHTWSVPMSFLNMAAYFAPGQYEGCRTAVIRITYSALSATLITPYTFIIPVPYGMEQQAMYAVNVLQGRVRTVS